MTRARVPAMLLLMLISLCCGCTKRSLVALVPDPDGRVGSLSVANDLGSVAIGAPYQATTVSEREEAAPSKPEEMGRERLQELFADALSVQPQRPLHFLLYFREDVTLRPESMARVPEILAAIAQRHSRFVSLIGHCDTLGPSDYNLDLARQRAEAVKELLVNNGVEAASLSTRWYGKRVLLVPTRDEVYERRNRAVEVIVR